MASSVVAWAQEPDSSKETSPSSLGDVARQTRAGRETGAENKSKAPELVDDMQREQEAEENAPTGYKNYNAGDYRLWVPFPFSLEGRDNGGAVLVGSRIGATTTEVMAGMPILLPAKINDEDLRNFVTQLAARYSSSASCYPIKSSGRKIFRCGFSKGSLLGREVLGSIEYVVGTNSLIPVMCASPDEVHQCNTIYPNGYPQPCASPYISYEQQRKTVAAVQAQYHDQMSMKQVCEQIIYPSIQLKEDIVVHAASIPDRSHESNLRPVAVARTTPGPVVALSESGIQTPSLAELARQTREAPRGKPKATLDSGGGEGIAPAGFQPFALQYCQNPQRCMEASIVIPEKAEVVSRTNGQHIFRTILNGEPVMLYAGPADVNAPYRSLTDPDYIRMRDLANANGWSREKAEGVSTQELTIDGKYALLTRFRYQRDQRRWWIAERVLIESRDTQFLVGCTAAEENFADAEALCSTLLNSVHLP